MSKIERNQSNKLRLEQYSTDLEMAYDMVSFIDSKSCIFGKNVADLGCGNGILGITAAIFGAKKVDMYDIDKRMTELTKKNVETLELDNVNTINKDIFDVDYKYDTAVSNPPFGFQSNFSIIAFIKKANKIADNLFFIYKDNKNIRNLAQINGMDVFELGNIKLQKSQYFHKKNSYTLPVILIYRLKDERPNKF
jgi:putative methylase